MEPALYAAREVGARNDGTFRTPRAVGRDHFEVVDVWRQHRREQGFAARQAAIVVEDHVEVVQAVRLIDAPARTVKQNGRNRSTKSRCRRIDECRHRKRQWSIGFGDERFSQARQIHVHRSLPRGIIVTGPNASTRISPVFA